MAGRHGVFTYEIPTALRAPIESESALQVAVGTAPVNMAAELLVNVPVPAYSYSEAVTKLGWSKDFEKYTLCQVMSASYQVFNLKPVIFINVLDPGVHNTAVPAKECTLINGAVTFPDFGVLPDSLVLKSKDGTSTYKQGTDYLAAFDASGLVVISVIPGGAIADTSATLSAAYTVIDPDKVTEDDIIGGYDAAKAKYRGIECISQVYPKLGLVPAILTAPGWSHNPAVAMALIGKTEQLNGSFTCVAYVDIDSSSDTGAPTYDKVLEWKNNNSYTGAFMYALWPKAVIADAVYYMSALAAARTGQTDVDNRNIPTKSPSNKDLRITGLINEEGDEVLLDKPQADYLSVSVGVATAVNINGWKLWGNYTAAFPGNTDPKDFWLNMRRFYCWDRNNTVLTFAGSVDDNISQRFIQTVSDTKNIQGNGYVAAGQLAAYKCEYLPDENPITDIVGGNVKFHITASPYPPAQEIDFIYEFDPYAVEEALAGGGA